MVILFPVCFPHCLSLLPAEAMVFQLAWWGTGRARRAMQGVHLILCPCCCCLLTKEWGNCCFRRRERCMVPLFLGSSSQSGSCQLGVHGICGAGTLYRSPTSPAASSGHAAGTTGSLLGTSVGVLPELWVQGLDPAGVSNQAFPVLWQLFWNVVYPLRKFLVVVPGILHLWELVHMICSYLDTAASPAPGLKWLCVVLSHHWPLSSTPSILCLVWE